MAIWAVGESKYLFFQGSVKFKDVFVDFSWEQWECLNAGQKNLYKKVMLDNYKHMMTLGKNKFSQLILIFSYSELNAGISQRKKSVHVDTDVCICMYACILMILSLTQNENIYHIQMYEPSTFLRL